jgi:5-methylcytosine-specific restriction enzyme A
MRALSVCPTNGCPELTAGGPCTDCTRKREQARGSSSQRGYGRGHTTRFRRGVLARDPVCVRCRRALSKHADHYPLSRDTLLLRGLDANDPRHGRGLCASCHSIETALHQGNNFVT